MVTKDGKRTVSFSLKLVEMKKKNSENVGLTRNASVVVEKSEKHIYMRLIYLYAFYLYSSLVPSQCMRLLILLLNKCMEGEQSYVTKNS